LGDLRVDEKNVTITMHDPIRASRPHD